MTTSDAAVLTPTISVDFDGVIHAHPPQYRPEPTGEPIEGAIDALRRLQFHYAVVVHTARSTSHVVGWLRAHGIAAVDDDWHPQCRGKGCDACDGTGRLPTWNDQELVLVTSHKKPAMFYIDDRAVEFTDWGSTLRRVLDHLKGKARPRHRRR